jgi:hypothetical protein
MKIGLYNLEPQIVNAAMMKVSTYHKGRDDEVEAYNHLFRGSYDKVYAFSIFKFTSKAYVTPEMITGGTGFDIKSRLPDEIEQCEYDYSLYPDCNYSLVWFSQGCIRACSFCIVREKECYIHPVKPKNLNQRGEYVRVMDNNFFANPEWRQAVQQLHEWAQPVDFEGIDARLLTPEMCEALNSLRHEKQIHIAWDDPRHDLTKKLREIIQYIKPYKLMCYVLIGYNSTPDQDLDRINKLREMNIDPFVMPFNKKDRYQMDFARWVNHKAIFKTVEWAEYRKLKSRTNRKNEEHKLIEVKRNTSTMFQTQNRFG